MNHGLLCGCVEDHPDLPTFANCGENYGVKAKETRLLLRELDAGWWMMYGE